MREVWRHEATEEPISFEGEFYRVAIPPMNPWGGRPMARPSIPVCLAGLRPLGLRLAGENADGLMAYFISPRYYDEVVAPNIAKGARKAGRNPGRHRHRLADPVQCLRRPRRGDAGGPD